MKIKRKLEFVSIFSRFRIMINDKPIASIKNGKEIEIKLPQKPFTLYFHSYSDGTSEKAIIDSDSNLIIKAKLHQVIVITRLLGLALLAITLYLMQAKSFNYIVLAAFILIIQTIMLFVVMKGRQIVFKVYDNENKQVHVKTNKKGESAYD